MPDALSAAFVSADAMGAAARARAHRVIAEKGYGYRYCRQLLRHRQISHMIPERSNQRACRAARPSRPLAFH